MIAGGVDFFDQEAVHIGKIAALGVIGHPSSVEQHAWGRFESPAADRMQQLFGKFRLRQHKPYASPSQTYRLVPLART